MKGLELSADPLAGGPMLGAYLEFGDYEKVMELFSGVPIGHPMYEIGLSMEKAIQGDFAGAAEIVEQAIDGVENPRPFQLGQVAGFAVLGGDFEKARKYVELLNPDFTGDADPEINAFNVANLIQYAFILQNQGEKQRANALLAMAQDVVRTLPRIGLYGQGIRDVQILALQGNTQEALATLRDAIDEGFRGTVASDGWPIALDPYLDSLRGQPAFEAMVGELEDAVAAMQQRVAQAELSGDWDALRAMTEST
jgi:tetratricopeptide (TPR) repeat protein